MEPGRAYHTGTAAPALTRMFFERSDRVAVPTTARVGAIEPGGTYMTGLEVFGAETPRPMLLEIIGGHPTHEVLAACASVLKELVRRSTDEVQRWAVHEFLTGDHRRRAEALLNEGYALLVPQQCWRQPSSACCSATVPIAGTTGSVRTCSWRSLVWQGPQCRSRGRGDMEKHPALAGRRNPAEPVLQRHGCGARGTGARPAVASDRTRVSARARGSTRLGVP